VRTEIKAQGRKCIYNKRAITTQCCVIKTLLLKILVLPFVIVTHLHTAQAQYASSSMTAVSTGKSKFDKKKCHLWRFSCEEKPLVW